MDATQLVWLIISTIIFGLLLYLTVLLLTSKTKAKDKLLMIFIVAILAVWIIPLIGGAITGVLVAIGNIFSFIPHTTNQMGQLGPIIIFLIMLIVVKYLIDTTWDRAVWISLISLFFLYLMFSIIPYIGEYMLSPL
ncbi:MAG: hypothetical protein ACTSU2_00870 [Promethearchaeota archaeon]